MSRHGYTDDWDGDMLGAGRWRGIVASATRGRRGQAFFRALRDALDAMPEKALEEGLVIGPQGACCAIGALLREREVPYRALLVGVDEYELQDWNETIAADLDVHHSLVQEVAYENDWGRYGETAAERWARMRRWVEAQIEGPEVQP